MVSETKSASKWITAVDAVHLLSPTLGGDKKAKKAILERLYDNSIKSTAWWLGYGIDIGSTHNSSPVLQTFDSEDDFVELSASELRELMKRKTQPNISSTRAGDHLVQHLEQGPILGGLLWSNIAEADLERCNWSTGFFIATGRGKEQMAFFGKSGNNVKHPKRLFALGVQFEEDDVLKIIGDSVPDRPKRRARKKSADWEDWIAELVLLEHEGGITVTATADSIIKIIAARLSERGIETLDRSTTFKPAKRVLEVLHEHGTLI